MCARARLLELLHVFRHLHAGVWTSGSSLGPESRGRELGLY